MSKFILEDKKVLVKSVHSAHLVHTIVIIGFLIQGLMSN